MPTYFISDLHLDESEPEIAKQFFNFLKTTEKKADALYILGDFFEIWIGDDDLTPFNLTVIKTLKDYTDSGIPTYIMHGNRDFLIGRRFLKATGCQLLKDPSLIKLYDIPVLLMHGDLLCTQDTEYLKVRKKLRNPARHALFFLFKSLKQRKEYATKLRLKSKERYKTIDKTITDADPDAINAYLIKYKADYLIHGHTHRTNIHHFKIGEKSALRAVLSSWHETPNMLVCTPSNDGSALAFKLESV